MFIHQSICVFVRPSAYPSVYLFIHPLNLSFSLSVYSSVCLLIYLSVCLLISVCSLFNLLTNQSACPSISPYVYLFINLFIHWLVQPLVCSSITLFIYQPICLFISLSVYTSKIKSYLFTKSLYSLQVCN